MTIKANAVRERGIQLGIDELRRRVSAPTLEQSAVFELVTEGRVECWDLDGELFFCVPQKGEPA